MEQLDFGHLQDPGTDARFMVEMGTQSVEISRVCKHHVCRIPVGDFEAGLKVGLNTVDGNAVEKEL
jgi:hypothetical protein